MYRVDRCVSVAAIKDTSWFQLLELKPLHSGTALELIPPRRIQKMERPQYEHITTFGNLGIIRGFHFVDPLGVWDCVALHDEFFLDLQDHKV